MEGIKVAAQCGALADIKMECSVKNRCLELANSSSFYRRIYSEIEEVGWEHVVKLGEDLTFLSFRIIDKMERAHILEITLSKTYPKSQPLISADVPYMFDLEWTSNSKLCNAVQQFREHLDKLHYFWLTLEEIDRSVWLADPSYANRASPCRKINIGSDCCIILLINAKEPRSLPECRFLGSDPKVNSFRKIWRRNCRRWIRDKSFSENLASVLDIQLPQPLDVEKNEQQTECGICYAQFLPIDDELGAKSGGGTDYTCENNSCGRAFHSVCLGDWLRSITTTRQSFDVLFGNCPYCSNPVAVKINTKK